MELFDRAADGLGRAPPGIESQDVLADPRGMLSALCAAVDIPFDLAMLAWAPRAPRDRRRVGAGLVSQAVELSTGFAAPRAEVRFDDLADALKPIAAAARPIYDGLAAYRLKDDRG